ncbi:MULTISPECIES: TolC family outer membrane protein [Roseobacter]|uniref:Outer membrane efflux protein n=1 Tax=Roseobacter litoralis (strain ATCC 49566 / DSM 6996 / JCM 21268 / NBRC 15278 / OCh 149) TaxID=391595 RepID=F7ZHY4_ROSLO|nr:MULTISPECIES: TolC family outer membrane protein [Roseobacter]AEI94934.1 outer membrane efflux protein [Roseobacter litoralis Och 149]GIT86886.1 transporter [Roseobacter sp. OBYS 0001]
MAVNRKTRGAARIVRKAAFSIGVVFALAGPAAQAETLADALASAYQNSGLLDQNRALLRAADEDVAGAVAALRPILNFTANVTRNFGTSRSTGNVGGIVSGLDSTQADMGLVASLLLYDGGAASLDVEAAKETVLATRQRLVSVEQQILLRAVVAYLSVYANRDAVQLRQNNLRLLSEELRAAQDRFEVGEVTRTDVAQAEASLAQARSGLATAQGDLQQAIEEYQNVIGRQPGQIAPPPQLPRLEGDVEAARALAVRTHPDLQEAQHRVAASEINIQRAESALKPTISAVGSLGITDDLESRDYSNSGTIGIELSQPIYRGGALSSTIRRAIAARDAELGNLYEVRKTVSQDVGNAYAALAARRASLSASEERIRAARIAFRGVREEATLGARTTLDVLDAEQELLDAETARISDEANLYIAAYGVLDATGRLTAQNLNLGVQQYDPTAYYNLAKDAPTTTSEQGRQLDRVLRSLQRN